MTMSNPVPNLVPVPDRLDLDLPIDAGAGLPIPRIRVIPADGDPYVVQALNSDLCLFEETAEKHRWQYGPTSKSGPFRWLTFLAWAASRRTGRLDQGVTLEVFRDSVMAVTSAEDTARPTPPGPGPG